MLYSLTRSLKCRQIGLVQIQCAVNGTAGTPAASGTDAAFIDSIVDNGVGSWTVVLKEASRLAPFVTGLVSLTPGAILSVSAVTTSSVTIDAEDAAGAPLDADFQVQMQFNSQLEQLF